SPAGRGAAKKLPCLIRHQVGLAIPAGKQVHQCVMRQVGYSMLLSRKVDAIRLATVSDDGIAGNSQLAGRRQDPDALVSEPVDVRRDDARWHDPEPIGVMRSCAREGCTFSMKIIGVGWVDS